MLSFLTRGPYTDARHIPAGKRPRTLPSVAAFLSESGFVLVSAEDGGARSISIPTIQGLEATSHGHRKRHRRGMGRVHQAPNASQTRRQSRSPVSAERRTKSGFKP